MALDYSKMIDAGFAFAGNRRRLSIQFVYSAIAITLLLSPLLLIMPLVKQFMEVYAATGSFAVAMSSMAPAAAIAAAAGAVLLFLAVAFLLWLACIFVHAFFAHNALTNSSFKQSIDAAKKKYLSVLLATIFIAFVGMAQAIILTPMKSIPVAGAFFAVIDFFVSIFFSLAFFFTVYAIMAKDSDAFKGISDGFNTFRQNPLETLASLVAITAVCLVITGISVIPVIAAAIAWVATGFSTSNVLLAVVAFAAALAILGFSYAQLYNVGAVANAFNQLNKRVAKKRGK